MSLFLKLQGNLGQYFRDLTTGTLKDLKNQKWNT